MARLLGQRLDHAAGTVHRDHGTVLQALDGAGGAHDHRLAQRQAHSGRMAVGAALLADDSGRLPDLGQEVVGGVGHHQHIPGAELGGHILQ